MNAALEKPDMQPIMRRLPRRLLLLGIALLPPSVCQAQMSISAGSRSLGGYGSTAISSYYGTSGGGYLPYNGGGAGFIPYRGSSDGALGTQPISRRLPQTPFGGASMAETPIGGASLSGNMSSGSSRNPGLIAGQAPRTYIPFGYEGGVGAAAGMSAMTSPGRGRTGPRPGP
ncbi:hypothetical protein ACYOEI_38585, partial [Singulisphaera rosea]